MNLLHVAEQQDKGDWPIGTDSFFQPHRAAFWVLAALIVNGLKYNRSPVPTVTLRISVEADVCVIRVADNGIGIEPAYLEDVFAPLKRLNNSSDFEGSGIGLSIVRRALKYQHGSVTCQSRVGEGSEFTVRARLSPPAPSVTSAGAASARRTPKGGWR